MTVSAFTPTLYKWLYAATHVTRNTHMKLTGLFRCWHANCSL